MVRVCACDATPTFEDDVMEPKDVLNNFKEPDPQLEALRKVISDALREAEKVPLCSQWEVAKPILEDGLRSCGDE